MAAETHTHSGAAEHAGHPTVKTYVLIGIILTVITAVEEAQAALASAEEILAQVMDAIEQSKKYMLMGAHHWKTTEEKAA